MVRWLITCAALPALLSLGAAAGAQEATPRIIGGDDASQNEWPWMAELDIAFTATNQFGLCGGVLLTPRWVMTAAHCLIDDNGNFVNASDITVRLGSVFLGDGAPYSSDGYGIPQGYQPSITPAFDNDIAMIRLATPGPDQANRPSIAGAAQLNALQAAPFAQRDEALTAIGWGLTSRNGTEPADRLQEVALDYIQTGSCKNAWGSGFNTNTMVCAAELNPVQGRDQDTCSGDSGGPLFIGDDIDPYVIGLTSFGQPQCAGNLPTVYTSVQSQVPFVEAITAQAGPALVDLSIELPDGLRYYAVPGDSASFDLIFANRSIANTVNDSRLSVQNGGLNITVDGSNCLASTCYQEATLPAQTARTLPVTASRPIGAGRSVESFTVNADATEEEYRAKNNRQEISVIFSDAADLSVDASILSSGINNAGEGTAEVAVTVRNLTTIAGAVAGNVSLTVNPPVGTSLTSSSVPCDSACNLGELSPGQSAEITLAFTSGTPQNGNLELVVNTTDEEFPETNNSTDVALSYSNITVTSPSNDEGGGGGGGGGGALGTLLALIALAGPRRRH
ncbi:MAG: serine protease [Alloalcanivorax venustensis]|uniref:serine protease n=1 Tax=Alloalcanivorax venustensis TaxID=172371 RepID=UPI0032974CB9